MRGFITAFVCIGLLALVGCGGDPIDDSGKDAAVDTPDVVLLPGMCTSDADCADELPCSEPTCDEFGYCVVTMWWCLIDGVCYNEEALNPANHCQRCDSVNFSTSWSSKNLEPCNDGDPCTIGEACSKDVCMGGEMLSCDDNEPCTEDSCDPIQGCQNIEVADETPCGPEGKDWCQGGDCVPNEECGNGILEGDEECDDGNTVDGDGDGCTDDGDCQVGLGCVGEGIGATASLNVADGDDNTSNQFTENEHIVITATDGTKRVYVLVDGSEPGAPTTGAVIESGADTGAGTLPSATTALGPCVAVNNNLNTHPQAVVLNEFRAAILGSTGHNGTIACSAAVIPTDGVQSLVLTQAFKGATGNTEILTDISLISTAGFTGGSDGPGNCENVCDYGAKICSVCNATCHNVPGATSYCGDGTKNGPEICDDGNTITEVCDYGLENCSVCDATCQNVPGATSYCGDGTKNGGEECDDNNTADGDGCSAACQTESVPISCADILGKQPASANGTYTIDPDGPGGKAPFEVYCDMTTDGGGWTLTVVSSDDGQNTWTWNNRHYWDTNTTIFGGLNTLSKDFKSRAHHEVAMGDLLFVHAPSGVWASYHAVGNGAGSLASKIGSVGGPICYAKTPGYSVSAGTLALGGGMCTTELYLNPLDQDGGNQCGSLEYPNHTYGPAWSVTDDAAGGIDSCPMDDPGEQGSLGPNSSAEAKEHSAAGFGWALNLNTGTIGSGQNNMRVYVR